MNLKKQLIQLGEDHKDLRPHLKVLVDYLQDKEGGSWYDKGETSPKTEPSEAPSPTHKIPEGKDQIFSGSPDSLRAFNTVILPQIQAKADAFSFEDMTKMMEEIDSLGTSKNTELENALIVCKPVSMNTGKFYQEIQNVFKDWMRPKLKGEGQGQEEGSTEKEDSKKEYNFNFQ